MPNRFHQLPFAIFNYSLIILIASIPYSRALLSISTGLLLIAAIAEVLVVKPKIAFSNNYFYCLIALFLLCLLDGLRAYSLQEWVKDIEIKIPLIIFPFSVIAFKNKLTPSFFRVISLIFCLSISTSTAASMLNYSMHYKEINELILQSKPMPIAGGMHHITYSVFCAFSVIVASVLAYQSKTKWLWILAIINFAGLHILTSRTGLVGFYFTVLILGLGHVIKNKLKPKHIIFGSLAILVLPIIAFFSISSLHNRVLNSWADLNVIWYQQDANYKSMGMRVVASKTAIDLIKKYPLTGIGNSNIKKAMGIQYEANNTNLYLENRIMPHNQFIMEAAAHGIPGLIILLLFFIMPLFNQFFSKPVLFRALWSLLFFAILFECLMERQHGIILVGLFWFLFASQNYRKPFNNENFENL